MRKLLITLTVVMTLCLTTNLALAVPSPVNATAAVTVTVDDIMEWASNFTTGIPLSNISSQDTVVDGNDTTTLYTNGNVNLTTAGTAVLTNTDPNSADTLVTEYRLTYDGDGSTATGGSTVNWTSYESFLTSASAITHKSEDGAVDVTLSARASNAVGTLADEGTYSTTQTITATWVP